MTDNRDLEQITQEDDKLEQRLEQATKRMRDSYAFNLDALKVMGAGNAAGVIAAAAALKNFSDHALLIKIAGASFLLGVFCFAIGYLLNVRLVQRSLSRIWGDTARRNQGIR